jgi:hypothetical protein
MIIRWFLACLLAISSGGLSVLYSVRLAFSSGVWAVSCERYLFYIYRRR